MNFEQLKLLMKKEITESNGFIFNENLKTGEQQCPQCGKTYLLEITKEQFAAKEGTLVQREQHQTGCCSDSCWNKQFPQMSN